MGPSPSLSRSRAPTATSATSRTPSPSRPPPRSAVWPRSEPPPEDSWVALGAASSLHSPPKLRSFQLSSSLTPPRSLHHGLSRHCAAGAAAGGGDGSGVRLRGRGALLRHGRRCKRSARRRRGHLQVMQATPPFSHPIGSQRARCDAALQLNLIGQHPRVEGSRARRVSDGTERPACSDALAKASELGAHACVSAKGSPEEVAAAVRLHTDGGAGADVSVDAAGFTETCEGALHATRRAGR